MNKWILIVLVIAVLLVGLFIIFLFARINKRRKQPLKFRENWLEIQRLCTNKDTWTLAVINADKLLNEALKQKRIKGKTMGERMVAAQRQFSDNDSVWYAHNLAKKLLEDSSKALRQAQAKKSLVGVRQALIDLGM